MLKQSSFELSTLLSALVDTFEPIRKTKGLQLSVKIDTSLPNRILSDLKRLRQILVNLIGNAVKHTSRGSVDIKLAPLQSMPLAVSADTDADPGINGRFDLEFTVSDTGSGIASDRMEHIFEPFGAGFGADSPALGNHYPGAGSTGLGLSICKRLVEHMGDRISAADSSGR